ncbi:4-hydroxyphenylpyruvate dioxygenase [Hyalangium rubrum]|uniref:4-hydroxyphenylpyruvate dioxygenase n=1 Tax=Hyalangium rubrum TaxID=3103134 RepID=A0ABU5HFP2_9BACT|nr:4-hydroxyphenylpyruvate dioxygenase [Hyalangium sp. s54d21]MDY7231982.1 4-hydroxyphenylpyruvate dioxygenase [Hyalangium sp. s54d21]
MILNPVGLQGIDFIEFVSPEPERLDRLFLAFGFSRTMHHPVRRIDLYEQGDIRLLLNRGRTSFAEGFSALHGPSICSMGWRVLDGVKAKEAAVARGARSRGEGDLFFRDGQPVPAVYGIGESLIYLVDGANDAQRWEKLGFVTHPEPARVPSKGFTAIDHLTNNVEKGTMGRWSAFYKDIFGFTEVRYFDIRGVKTGLTSYALRSPCGTFCIPINEATEKKSQINEYLEEYKGPGVQHLAFVTTDILGSLRALEGTDIQMLDMDDEYYREVFERVPGVTEDREEIRRRNVLVDGDEEGYLLQIFTRNLIGPIFIEIIQRKNHLSFGEGNFGALFRSIERDQAKRGVFDERS